MNMVISQITTRYVKYLTCFQILRQAIANKCGDTKKQKQQKKTLTKYSILQSSLLNSTNVCEQCIKRNE